MTRNQWYTHWPMLAGTVIIAVSCALLKAPADLTSDSNLDDVFTQGEFREPDGEVTEGGTVSGSWDGTCDMYGYPYELELTLSDADGVISGTGRWITSWGEFNGTVEGERSADGVDMNLMVDYYGYDYAVVMEADFDGLALVGNCDAFYSTGGYLNLERV